VERSYGSFSRIIPLPFDPDPAKVEAKFDKGVLHVQRWRRSSKRSKSRKPEKLRDPAAKCAIQTATSRG
jgi:HSP20 family protein